MQVENSLYNLCRKLIAYHQVDPYARIPTLTIKKSYKVHNRVSNRLSIYLLVCVQNTMTLKALTNGSMFYLNCVVEHRLYLFDQPPQMHQQTFTCHCEMRNSHVCNTPCSSIDEKYFKHYYNLNVCNLPFQKMILVVDISHVTT